MHGKAARRQALRLLVEGRILNSVSKQLGMNRSTIRTWRDHGVEEPPQTPWPGLLEECTRAIREVRPHNSVFRVQNDGCVVVSSCSTHWPCLFPQHGPGRKHLRRIALEPWQQQLVEAHPWELIRGPVHSDGCRFTNWTTRVVGGARKRYEYPRYLATNKSADILHICGPLLDKVGVEWKLITRSDSVYHISRRPTCGRRVDGRARRAEVLSAPAPLFRQRPNRRA